MGLRPDMATGFLIGCVCVVLSGRVISFFTLLLVCGSVSQLSVFIYVFTQKEHSYIILYVSGDTSALKQVCKVSE